MVILKRRTNSEQRKIAEGEYEGGKEDFFRASSGKNHPLVWRSPQPPKTAGLANTRRHIAPQAPAANHEIESDHPMAPPLRIYYTGAEMIVAVTSFGNDLPHVQ
jgi:hypothetical protein